VISYTLPWLHGARVHSQFISLADECALCAFLVLHAFSCISACAHVCASVHVGATLHTYMLVHLVSLCACAPMLICAPSCPGGGRCESASSYRTRPAGQSEPNWRRLGRLELCRWPLHQQQQQASSFSRGSHNIQKQV